MPHPTPDGPDSRFRILRELFEAAMERPAGEREAFVRRLAGADVARAEEVLAMLRAAEDVRSTAFTAGAQKALAAAADEPLPERIGPYRILTRLGRGAMGVVYRAERPDLKNHVAIKVSQRPLGLTADEVVTRFQLERRALAAMNHRCIAKIFDAGTTEQGQPYFVMELVEGVPLTQYCDERRLSVKQRLQLFQQICEGVQHAHGKFVVHRDLKPDNVLVVNEGGTAMPKILDFGLAKATDPEHFEAPLGVTGEDRRLGTLLYMSPEQTEGRSEQVDARSDIYTLGVMLYELLAGQLPFPAAVLEKVQREAGRLEVLRMLSRQDPDKPSTRVSTLVRAAQVAAMRGASTTALRRTLTGDLDQIVLKAMAKEPERRYAAATALAEDIGRYLEHLPVRAGPPSASYRLRKFVRRYRGQVVAGTTVFVVLAGSAVGFYRLYGEARDAERQARSQTAEASMQLAGRLAARGLWTEAVAAYDQAAANSYPDAFALAIGRVDALEPLDHGATTTALAAIDESALMPRQRAKLLMLRAQLLTDWSEPAAGLETLRQARELGLEADDDAYSAAILATNPREAWQLVQRALVSASDHRGLLRLAIPLALFFGSAREVQSLVGQYRLLYAKDASLLLLSATAQLFDDADVDLAQVRLQLTNPNLQPADNASADAFLDLLELVAQCRRTLATTGSQGITVGRVLEVLKPLATLWGAGNGGTWSFDLHPSLAQLVPLLRQYLGGVWSGTSNAKHLAQLEEILPDGIWQLFRASALSRQKKFDEALVALAAASDQPSFMSRLIGAAGWNLVLLQNEHGLLINWSSEQSPTGVDAALRGRLSAWAGKVLALPSPPSGLLEQAMLAAYHAGDQPLAVEACLRWARVPGDSWMARFWLGVRVNNCGDLEWAKAIYQQLQVEKPDAPNVREGLAALDGALRLRAFAEVERLLLQQEPATATHAETVDAAAVTHALYWLYGAWEQQKPGSGYAAKAATYRNRLTAPR